MKKSIRIISLFLTISFVFFLFASCAQQEAEEEVFDLDFVGEEIPLDFGGASVIFITEWIPLWKPEIGFSLAGDNMNARYKEVKDKFNCNIEFVYKAGGDAGSYVLATVAAQSDDIPDLIDCHTYQAVGMYASGLLYAMDDISTIDLSDEKWGNKNFIRYGRFAGKQYGFYAYDWEIIPQIVGVVAFDTTVLTHFGLTSPHELLETGKWTWDEFEKMCATATTVDGDFRYTGLCYGSATRLAQSAIFANGGEIIHEENGVKTSAITSPQVIGALEWIQGLNAKKYLGTYSNESFNNHEFLFAAGESYFFTVMSTSLQNSNTPVYGHTGYGVTCFPSGPMGEYGAGGHYICEGRRLNWINAQGPTDKDDLGRLLDFMFEPLEGQSEKAWIDCLETNIFFYRDIEGELFPKMVESVRYDWSAELAGAYDTLTAKFGTLIKGTESASAAMQSVEGAINERLSTMGDIW